MLTTTPTPTLEEIERNQAKYAGLPLSCWRDLPAEGKAAMIALAGERRRRSNGGAHYAAKPTTKTAAERKAARAATQARYAAKHPRAPSGIEKQRIAKKAWAARSRAEARAAKQIQLEADMTKLYTFWLGLASKGWYFPQRTIKRPPRGANGFNMR